MAIHRGGGEAVSHIQGAKGRQNKAVLAALGWQQTFGGTEVQKNLQVWGANSHRAKEEPWKEG